MWREMKERILKQKLNKRRKSPKPIQNNDKFLIDDINDT